jgi:hypothetical protein
MSKSQKRTFILKNLNPHSVKLTYGLLIVSNLQKGQAEDDPHKTTRIENVITVEEHGVSFLDEQKKEMKCVATMVEWVGKNQLPISTNMHCFWCRHSFASCPIGCPINYVNPMVEKSYTSQITKDKYYMRENVTQKKLEEMEDSSTSSLEIRTFPNHYFLTDGIFCSFNCVLAFILSKYYDSFYAQSYHLLHTMYEQFIGKQMRMHKILPAPDWRLLKPYGGPLSIEEYRRSFNHIEYKELFNITEMRTLSKVYMEK